MIDDALKIDFYVFPEHLIHAEFFHDFVIAVIVNQLQRKRISGGVETKRVKRSRKGSVDQIDARAPAVIIESFIR